MSTFNPSPAELGLVNQVFSSADPRELGIITGDVAVKVFAGSKLPPAVLGEIWSIADKDNNGFLTRKGVAIALRLIGHAQKGETVKESLVDRPGPLAHIDGISAPTPQPSSIPSSPPPQSPPPRSSLHPPLTAEDKSKFLRLFLKCGPVNGLLSGDKARDVFIKSKLPFEKLSQIWTLADTQDRGSLDQTDFTIAMYLIQASMSGQLSSLPTTLPPGLYEQAGGGRSSVISHNTGNSVSLSPSLTGSFASTMSGASGFTATPLTSQTTGGSRPSLQPQMTGQNYRQSAFFPSQFTPNPVAALGASAFGNNAGPSQVPWDVTAEEKARFDKFFDTLDIPRRGFIEGEVAVPFMLQSKLSGDVLAQVWDLADLNNDGHLTREGFAIAMHLIQGKLAGKEIPATLPPSLVPPSMRATLQGASAFGPVSSAPAPVPEPIRDLLWDDSPPASATAAQHTIPTVASPPNIQSPPILQNQATGYVSQHNTGAFSARSPPSADPFGAPSFTPSAQRDLFGDEEDAAAAAVPDNSVEIGNLQNQLNSTNKSLDSTKAERQNMEQTLATQASQLSALQTQLSSAKAAFETETRLLESLRERFAKQTADMQKAREELIRAESDLSGVRVEKAEVEGSIMRDKEDVRELQRKMKEAGDEIQQAKAAVEKAKKETKHQKGLLAIAKKQLATREAERAKVLKELEDAEREAQESKKELESAEAELAKELPVPLTNGTTSASSATSSATSVPLARVDTPAFAATQPLPASPSVSTPLSLTSPSGKSNNPFERLALSTGSRPSSPFAATNIDLFSAPAPQTEAVVVTSPNASSGSPDAVEQPEAEVARSTSPFTNSDVVASVPQSEAPRASSPFMHVAEASVSTNEPSTAAPTTTDDDDPFGLDAIEDKHDSMTSISTTAEKAEVQSNSVSVKELSVEPAVDLPPSAEAKSVVAEGKKPASASFDTHFPPIGDAISGGFSGFDDHTDLDSKLVEKEHDDESDSDSDDEGVFHDANARLSTFSTGKEENEEKVKTEFTANGSAIGAAVEPAEPASNFDDAFGLGSTTTEAKSETTVNGSTPSSDLFSAFTPSSQVSVQPINNGSAAEKASPFDFTPVATPAAGLSAFDEALGKMSTPGSSTAPQFKLDSAFDDDFDFTAAKASEPAAAFPINTPAIQPISNGSTETPKATPDFAQVFGTSPVQNGATTQPTNTKSLSFEDAFGSVSSRLSTAPSGGDHGISFEEAFGGKGLSFSEVGSVSSVPTNGQAAGEKQSTSNAAPFPIQSPPGSPTVPATTPASPSTVRSMRSASPPPRVSSPKPRASTGSSNEGGPSVKPPPQRHSKLSIRLPFGRKDKKKSKHEPPPVPPPQFLAPVQEPSGTATPSVEDDVEPVKQLCSMGFSRTQAIEALEKYGYDVQRALNSLLGAA